MNTPAYGHPHISLIGMMGSGKTSIGRLVAKYLDWPFLDADAVLVERVGCSISDMFSERGEQWFRNTESDVLAELALSPVPSVLSVGGGAVLRQSNRDVLRRTSLVVWLRATPETLIERIGAQPGRPLLAEDPEGRIRRLTEERSAVYRDGAHEVIDVDDLRLHQVAELIVAVYEAHQAPVDR
jgi:shikimate kinase